MSVQLLASVMPACNATLLSTLAPSQPHYPIYHTAQPSILSFVTDKHLSLAIPVIAYWVFSLLFHTLDILQLPYFEKMRIHESEEVLSRNRATISQVIGAVVAQQVVQTLLGWVWLESEEEILKREVWRDHTGDMQGLALVVGKGMQLLLGERTALNLATALGGEKLVGWVYWWAVPIAQMGLAFFIIDTWQYFLHRLFHSVPFLYRNFHSVHHRLYVPYAFGALYNHPVEGLLLDSLGAVLAHSAAGMTIRQTILLFGISTIKTVDDHCGYKIWWDPCQALFGNNAEYHDLHHQSWGIKKNFSQPFFTKWDDILGTRMSKTQAVKMYAKRSKSAIQHTLSEAAHSADEMIKTILAPSETDSDDGRETPVEDIDSGIEVDDGREGTGRGKSSSIQTQRARSRKS